MRPEAVPGLRRLTDAVHAEERRSAPRSAMPVPSPIPRSNRAAAPAPVRFFNPIAMKFARRASRDDIEM